jgi:hypothetical protein
VGATLRARIYEDDAGGSIVASQWSALHTASELVGARALAAALVAEAWLTATHVIRPLAPGRHSKFIRRHHRQECTAQREAIAWFYRDGTAPFSFLFVCHHLGLSPGRVREALAVALEQRGPSPQVPAVSSSSSPDFCRDQWEASPLVRHGT